MILLIPQSHTSKAIFTGKTIIAIPAICASLTVLHKITAVALFAVNAFITKFRIINHATVNNVFIIYNPV